MAAKLKLHSSQIADLEAVRDIGSPNLRLLIEQLNHLNPVPLRIEKLLNTAYEVFPNRKLAESTIRQAVSIRGLGRQSGLSVDEVIQSLQDAIGALSEWTAVQKQTWNGILPIFRELVATNAVRLVATTIDLSYEYANLFRRARVVTDIRPLYNDEGTTIEGSVISHTMRLRYDTANGDHSLSIAMDESDIKVLMVQCERALLKARTAKTAMTAIGVPTTVTGENDGE